MPPDPSPALQADAYAELLDALGIDRAVIARQFETLFPVSERIEGILFDAFRSNRDINRGYPLGQITAPALVVHAKDDPGPPFLAAAELAAQIPGARLLSVERGGHLMLGKPPAER